MYVLQIYFSQFFGSCFTDFFPLIIIKLLLRVIHLHLLRLLRRASFLCWYPSQTPLLYDFFHHLSGLWASYSIYSAMVLTKGSVHVFRDISKTEWGQKCPRVFILSYSSRYEPLRRGSLTNRDRWVISEHNVIFENGKVYLYPKSGQLPWRSV